MRSSIADQVGYADSTTLRGDVDGHLGDQFPVVPGGEVEAPLRKPRRNSRRSLFASYAITVLALVCLNFFLPRVLPGDPISALIDSASPSYVQSEELRAELEAYYGLDRPLVAQFGDYVGDLATGDLGTSIRYNRPVAELVWERLPWTLLLITTAMILAAVMGWLAGAHSGWRRGRPVDSGLLVVFMGLRSFPGFFLASIALFIFAVQADLVPLSGAQTPFASMGALERVGDIAHHLVLPAFVMALPFAGGQYHLMRASVVTELGADHLELGRAKGLRNRRLKYRYAARNALLPVVTLAAIHFSGAVTTEAIVIETVFAYPGMGRLLFDAVPFRDYPTLQACFLVLGLVVVTGNLLADLLYRRLDPRTRT
ncbi:MAG TPA: ABC transporter permease [Acidimicrobiales bacterium]|nr:ABC transporter permease [Acidimicrobiales bacterium]